MKKEKSVATQQTNRKSGESENSTRTTALPFRKCKFSQNSITLDALNHIPLQFNEKYE